MSFDFSQITPFSFTYGKVSSSCLLNRWSCVPDQEGNKVYFDEKTQLEVVWEKKEFHNFPAVEWVLRFCNKGKEKTPLLEDIHALDLNVTKSDERNFLLHHALGSTCSADDYMPLKTRLLPGKEICLSPNGGRSSDGHLPFFNLEWGGQGMMIALGWSGQWAIDFRNTDKHILSIQAGMEKTYMRLLPGESIRTPRILLVYWEGDKPIKGHNLLRQLLLKHYIPNYNDIGNLTPVAYNSWFVFNLGNEVTEENQLHIMDYLPSLGIEAFWLDAGWFEGGWQDGIGNWTPRKDAFPRGLKPLADKAHSLGMKFLVWFEPERVRPGTQIARLHPEWVLPDPKKKGNGLFNLGIPEARKWITALISRCIIEWDIDIYRQDFNISPLKYWEKNDDKDRKGTTELHYIEGLYTMWDELLSRHKNLVIDNCSSGCRRIDLETVSRSVPLWHSDIQAFCKESPLGEDNPMGKGSAGPVTDQLQTAGLFLFIPFHSAGCWSFAPYRFRSVMTTGVVIVSDIRKNNFPIDLAKKSIAELKMLRKFFIGNYYPLTEICPDEREWFACQFHRPDLNEGVALVFRRSRSNCSSAKIALHEIEQECNYKVVLSDNAQKEIIRGKNLLSMEVSIPFVSGSLIIHYSRCR